MIASLIVLILFVHFVADFVCQSRWMGENKSHNAHAMAAHIGTYYFVLFGLLMFVPYLSVANVAVYATVNALAHLLTDSVTSRLTSNFYADKKMHHFWTTIGFDQFAHAAALIYTLPLLGV